MNRQAERHLGKSNSSPRYNLAATANEISTPNIWPCHFQLSGQHDAKTVQAVIFQLEGDNF